MIRTGEVTAVKGDFIEVTFCRPADCEKCHACHGGQKQTTLTLRGAASVGDQAVVEMPTRTILSASAIAYAMPLAGLMLGLVGGTLLFPQSKDVAGLAGGVAGLIVAAAITRLTERFRRGKAKWQPTLKEIIPLK